MIVVQVTEPVFWARYLFRIHVVKEEDAQRQVIRKEAQVRAQVEGRPDDLNWDDGMTRLTYNQLMKSNSFTATFASRRIGGDG